MWLLFTMVMVELGNKKYPLTPLEVHNIALGAGTASKLSASALVDKM
jgi:hypothetical protein